MPRDLCLMWFIIGFLSALACLAFAKFLFKIKRWEDRDRDIYYM